MHGEQRRFAGRSIITTGKDKDVDNTQELTILSLCTGYGGLELAAHQLEYYDVRSVPVRVI